MSRPSDFSPEAIKGFKELCRQSFSDQLHERGGDWSQCDRAMDEHWEDLFDIMLMEVTDRADDWIREHQPPFSDEPHPSLSAAERNPSLR